MEPRSESAVRIRPKTHPAAAVAHRTAIFTALDGTLLDARTFDGRTNRAFIRQLVNGGTPVIPVSAMTLEEIEPIARDLGFRHAMIIEAGGAIARWNGKAWEIEPCGPPAETFLRVIADIEERSGANLLVYSAMDDALASQASGRAGDMLQASTHRCYSEPFLIESGELSAVEDAASQIGFSVRRGRRFFHLCRACDEGEAFARLRDELQCDVAIAVGGSAIDAEFLMRADAAIIVPGPDGTPDAALLAAVPSAQIAPAPAPAGWALAVDEALQSLRAPKKRPRRAVS